MRQHQFYPFIVLEIFTLRALRRFVRFMTFFFFINKDMIQEEEMLQIDLPLSFAKVCKAA